MHEKQLLVDSFSHTEYVRLNVSLNDSILRMGSYFIRTSKAVVVATLSPLMWLLSNPISTERQSLLLVIGMQAPPIVPINNDCDFTLEFYNSLRMGSFFIWECCASI